MLFCCPDRFRKSQSPAARDRTVRFRAARLGGRSLLLAAVVLAAALRASASTPSTASHDAQREASILELERDGTLPALPFDAGDSLRLVARDLELDRARAARALIRRAALATPGPGAHGPPDSLESRAIALSIDAYSRALLHESAMLSSEARSSALGARPSRFAEIWCELVGEILGLIDSIPATGARSFPVPDGEIDLPGLLLSLCLPDAYAGDTFALPRESLPLRMATLPDSLAACCMDAERCRDAGIGSDCAAYVAGIMAESVDQDAMVGFRYAARYWSLLADESPRNPSRDGRIAAATVRFLTELLEASETDMPEASGSFNGEAHGPDGTGGFAPRREGAIPVSVALERLRASGKLWPSSIDPFVSVPGLRNPRWTGTGAMLCDVALYRAAVDALNSGTRDWLVKRLGPGRSIVLVEPR